MRTLDEQIQRLRDVLVTCYNAIKRKGGTIPEAGERNMSNLPAAVLSIPQIHGVLTDLEVTADGEYLPADYDADVEADPDIRVADGCYYEDGSRVPYGISILRLFCSKSVNNITKIVDKNKGWGLDSKLQLSFFPNLTDVELGCGEIRIREHNPFLATNKISNLSSPYATIVSVDNRYGWIEFSSPMSEFNYSLKAINTPAYPDPQYGDLWIFTGDCDIINFDVEEINTGWHTVIIKKGNVRELNMRKTKVITSKMPDNYHNNYLTNHSTTGNSLKVLRLGNLEDVSKFHLSDNGTALPNLIHIEVEGCECNLNLKEWNPTAVLADPALTEQFLYNFKTYIAERVADRTGKTALTLTLSAAVYGALTDEIKAILTSKNWTIAQA